MSEVVGLTLVSLTTLVLVVALVAPGGLWRETLCLLGAHKVDPEKWVEVGRADMARQAYVGGVPMGDQVPIGTMVTWSNTCAACGALVVKKAMIGGDE